MVYRIHFTTQDLARTRVAEAPMPLSELELAARVLQDRSQPVRLEAWRRRCLGRLTAPARMVLSLIPPVGWSPTFLAPSVAGTAEEVLEQVQAVPRSRIRAELAAIAEHQPVPSWARHLADDTGLRRQMHSGLTSLYATLLEPYWTSLTGHFTADRTVRMRQFLDGGVEHVLAQANPRWMRWNPPVLDIRMANGVEYDLHLEGQGILLVPSLWGTRTIVDNDAVPQPTVTYPVLPDRPVRHLTALAREPGPAKPADAVAALLGGTRAAVLNAIATHPGCTTKELASLVGVASASASEHATTLRAAGLVQTLRHRNSALHSATPLGVALLNEGTGSRAYG
ncbi:winged helix-turn-helix domain-containing protein [Streptomyces sp. NPDC046931]|uniref:ArsR/SmtB family transcription factor n=1 Tax=Streptomyces sp. NPDC046931 TaxID=3154806 RepID=UPI0033C9DF2E